MEDAIVTFEIMSISEEFVTVRMLSRIAGVEMPISQEVHCLKVGETLNIPFKFSENF